MSYTECPCSNMLVSNTCWLRAHMCVCVNLLRDPTAVTTAAATELQQLYSMQIKLDSQSNHSTVCRRVAYKAVLSYNMGV